MKVLQTALVFIFVTTLFSCAHSPAKAGSNALDKTDSKMLEQLAAVFDVFSSQSAEIWNQNFRLEQMPLLLVRKGKNRDLYGFLVNHPQPESFEESEKVELAASLGLPPVYYLKALPRKKELAEFPYFMFQFELNGTNVFLMKYTDYSIDPFSSPLDEKWWPLYLTHEAFHNGQFQYWTQSYQGQDIEGYPLDQTHLALIMLEDAALKMAVEETQTAEYLRYFLAVREERIRLVPEVTQLDFEQERIEGTAQYIQHRLGELLQHPAYNLQSFAFQLPYYAIGESNIRGIAAFYRFYATGATLGYLLDELEIPWKERVEQGESPYQVLRQSLRQKLDMGPDDLLEAKQKLNFAAIQIRAEKAALQEQREPNDLREYPEKPKWMWP